MQVKIKGKVSLRRTILLLILTVSATCWATNGDMGVGTDPNTDGSATHPWLIEDLMDFDTFSDSDNAAIYWVRGVHTKLVTNIDLSGRNYTTAVIAPDIDNTNWDFDGIPYEGMFDGNSYSITNLTIDTEEADNNYLGLFGQINGTQAQVKKLGIEHVLITGEDDLDYVGALAGENYRGIVSNCHSTGQVSGNHRVGGLVGYNRFGVVKNCNSSSTISGTGDFFVDSEFGGLVAYNYFGLVASSYSTGSVYGFHSVGGVVGVNQGNLMNCYSTGSVSGDEDVGGFVGRNSVGTIANCYSTGSVSGDSNVGGFVGSEPSLGGRMINCFWDTDVSGFGSEGDDNYGATGKTTLQLHSLSTFTDAGWDFIDETVNGTSQIWQMPLTDGYPVLSSFNGYVPVDLNGVGSNVDPYLISNASQLGAIYHYHPRSCYRLIADIDLTGIQWSTAVIPALYGSFDGAGYTIVDLTIDGGGYLALVGFLGSDEPLNDLGLEDILITGTGNYSGGLVGYSFSDNVINCYTTGSISGYSSIGGLVGQNLGTVTNCYSLCSIYGINYHIGGLVGMNYGGSIATCYSTGPVTGGTFVGGLLGSNYGPSSSATDSYATGSVTGTVDTVGGVVGSNGASFPSGGILTNCYSIGSVTCAGEHVGGVMGDNYGTSSGCFWDVQSSGFGNPEDDNFGATGKTTLQMQTQSTFTEAGWDFAGDENGPEDIWWMPASDYPELTSMGCPFTINADLNSDCKVDLTDISILALSWLDDVELIDLSIMAQDWLTNCFADPTECESN